jgi:hypothetical protein
MTSEIEETAKAAQEIAKTTGKAIEAGEKFGRFISKYIGGPLEQSIGIFEDKLKYMRWERQLRLMQRANELLATLGISGPTRQIPAKLAIPLLQAASLEDDDYLQDMWAKLLVNAADSNSGIDLKRTYIDILERLTPLEAKILEKLYEIPFDETQHNGIRTDGLPNEVNAGKEDDTRKNWEEPSDEVKLALISLAHVGCISPVRTWGGGELFSSVNPTLLGKYFVDACSLRKQP